jgi:uncharacterized membrane-anchored protein
MAGRHQARSAGPNWAGGGASKVPAVKPYFWGVKLLTTAMGEAVSDYLVNDWNKYGAVVVGFVLFAVTIAWQFRTRWYRTWPYWSAVAMVAVFGTMCADVMHIVLHLQYPVTTTFYAVCLAVTFVVWYRSEGTLDIHSIVTPRREVFYWLAVIFTFAMGTAVGDLTAHTLHLGYLASAFLFTAMICVPLIAWRLGANPVLTFWVAYVLTRPIGASLADFFGMPKNLSGLGYGHGTVSVVTLILTLASFAYLARSGIDRPEDQAPRPAPRQAPAQPGAVPQTAGYYPPNGPGPSYTGQDARYGGSPRQDPRYPDPRYGDQRDYRAP